MASSSWPAVSTISRGLDFQKLAIAGPNSCLPYFEQTHLAKIAPKRNDGASPKKQALSHNISQYITISTLFLGITSFANPIFHHDHLGLPPLKERFEVWEPGELEKETIGATLWP